MTAIESACFLLLPHLPDLRPPASQQSPKQKSLGHRSLGKVGRASKSLGAVLFCFTLRRVRFNFTADISVQSSSVSLLLLTSLFWLHYFCAPVTDFWSYIVVRLSLLILLLSLAVAAVVVVDVLLSFLLFLSFFQVVAFVASERERKVSHLLSIVMLI